MSLEKLQSKYFDLVYGAHNATQAQDYVHAAKHYDHNLKDWLSMDRTKSILELGCGVGFFLYFCQGQGYSQLTGVDLSTQMLEKADKVTSAKLIHANALHFLKETTQTWDCIVFMDLIEHFTVPEAMELVSLVYKHLTPQGQLILKTPNMESLFASSSRYIDLTHQCGFTSVSLYSLLKQSGFKQIDFKNETPSTTWTIPENPWENKSLGLLKKLWRTLYYTFLRYRIPIRIRRSEQRLQKAHENLAKVFGRNPQWYSQNIWARGIKSE